MNLSVDLIATRVLPRLQRALTWLGWPGVSGVALLLCAWVLHGVWLPGLQAEHDEAQSQVDLLRHQLQSQAQAARATEGAQGAKAAASSLTAEQAWAALWQRLPEHADITARQADALDRATRLGLRLDSVQFKGAPVKDLPQVWRQQITLPLQGRHADLMAWLNHAWAQADWSIDGLDLTRDDVMSDQVKARVTLSIWARANAPAAALATSPRGGQP